ncbi:MAG: hypothetical protein KGJ36_08205 [Acidobacteriota bacterium]|nr:hypothetical protein [Acidobacteriota bacterium]
MVRIGDAITHTMGVHTPVRETKGRLALTLVASAGVVASCLAPSAPATTASAAVARARLVVTYELCQMAPPTTTTPATTTTTDPSVPSTLPPLAPYVILLAPPPVHVVLIRRGRVAAATWIVSFAIPSGYRNVGHPDGPSGITARAVLSAPPGHYVLHGMIGQQRVTLVAGRTTRLLVRQGNCW